MVSKVCGGPTGTGRSNAYFVASLNGGQSFIWGGTGPHGPCRAATARTVGLRITQPVIYQLSKGREMVEAIAVYTV